MILITNANVSDIKKVGMKLLNTGKLVTRNTTWEISLNMRLYFHKVAYTRHDKTAFTEQTKCNAYYHRKPFPL
jgi:hypothetical protein